MFEVSLAGDGLTDEDTVSARFELPGGVISSERTDTDRETSKMAKSTKIGDGRRKAADRTSAEIGASRIDDAEYDRLFIQTTSDSSDVFLDRNSEMLRRLNKRSIASFSYRIGMADLVRAVETDLGKEKAELMLRALERKNNRRRIDPDFEYTEEGGNDHREEDELEDDDCDEEGDMDPLERFLRRKRLSRRRGRRRDDRDPMFG